MWSAKRTIIREGQSEIIALQHDGAAASFADVVAAWRDKLEFRDFFIRQLAGAPYPAYFWEMPPIRRDTMGRDFKFVVIRSEALAHMPPDADAFRAKFEESTCSVVTFRNLGRDALLVAPRPISGITNYIHLAAFLRTAPEAQRHDLFLALARAIEAELQETAARIWISTSGLGIAWLHIRLDSFPKYYQHRPFAEDN